MSVEVAFGEGRRVFPLVEVSLVDIGNSMPPSRLTQEGSRSAIWEDPILELIVVGAFNWLCDP